MASAPDTPIMIEFGDREVRLVGPTLEAIANRLDQLRSNKQLMRQHTDGAAAAPAPAAPPAKPKSTLTPAGRKRLSAASKSRWAQWRAEKKQAAEAKATAKGKAKTKTA